MIYDSTIYVFSIYMFLLPATKRPFYLQWQWAYHPIATRSPPTSEIEERRGTNLFILTKKQHLCFSLDITIKTFHFFRVNFCLKEEIRKTIAHESFCVFFFSILISRDFLRNVTFGIIEKW